MKNKPFVVALTTILAIMLLPILAFSQSNEVSQPNEGQVVALNSFNYVKTNNYDVADYKVKHILWKKTSNSFCQMFTLSDNYDNSDTTITLYVLIPPGFQPPFTFKVRYEVSGTSNYGPYITYNDVNEYGAIIVGNLALGTCYDFEVVRVCSDGSTSYPADESACTVF